MKAKYIFSLISASVLAIGMPSCSPDDIDMPQKNVTTGDLAEGIAYTITPDAENPNIIYLDSKMPDSYKCYWEHPQGRSQDKHVELHIPFEGTYDVRFGVETRGGVAYGEPTSFTITTFCAEFVTDQLWTYLTGGVGKSKVWIYDNGKYGYKAGELTYGDPAANPNFGWNSFSENWDPGRGHCGEEAMWESTMTFDLDGGAHYSFFNSTAGTTQNGVFNFNTTAHTLTLSDADLMHPDSWNDRNPDWRRDLKIIELDENHMRIGYVRVPGNWGGEWCEVFNYVSKEYADSYQPPMPDQAEEVPTADEQWYELFTNQNKYASWRLSTETPFDWCNLDGSNKHFYGEPSDYPAQHRPYELDGNLDIKFASPGPQNYSVSLPNGATYAGNFTATPDGKITFDAGIGSIALADGISFEAAADNSLRVLSYLTDDLGRITEMWLGRREADMNDKAIDYLGYHFVANFGGGAEEPSYKATLNWNNTSDWTMVTGDAVFVREGTYTLNVNATWTAGDPCVWVDVDKILRDHTNCDVVIRDIKVDGVSVAFDDSVISRGYPDDDASTNSARRYICNPWGLASCFPSLDVFHPAKGIEVTIQVIYDNGAPFIGE